MTTRYIAKRNLFLTSELLKIVSLMKSYNIEVVSFKGVVLAQTIYGNLSSRYCCDIDLLIHKEDMPSINNLLLKEGFSPILKLNKIQEEALLDYHDQLTYKHQDGFFLDLHTLISPKYFYDSTELTSEIWGNLEEIEIAGEKIKNIKPEYLIYLLCIHGTKHFWGQLRLVRDFSKLIEQYKDLDWGKIIKKANKLHIQRMLFLGLHLVSILFKTNIPVQNIKTSSRIRNLAKKSCKIISSNPADNIKFLEKLSFHLQVMDNPAQKIKYLLHTLITPSISDWTLIPLPGHLFFLYYFIRPFRLIKKIFSMKNS